MFPAADDVARQSLRATELSRREVSPRCILEKLPLLATVRDQRCHHREVTTGDWAALTLISACRLLSDWATPSSSYVRYLGKAVWPSRLALFYPHPGTSLPMWQVFASLVVLLALLHWSSWRGTAALSAGGLVLVSGNPGADDRSSAIEQAGHGRSLRLPDIRRLVHHDLLGRSRLARRNWEFRLSGCAAPAVARYSCWPIVTYRQLGFWSDNQTLWSHTLEVTRDNYLAEDIVGSALMDQGQPEEALPHFQAAAESTRPTLSPPWPSEPMISSVATCGKRLTNIRKQLRSPTARLRRAVRCEPQHLPGWAPPIAALGEFATSEREFPAGAWRSTPTTGRHGSLWELSPSCPETFRERCRLTPTE